MVILDGLNALLRPFVDALLYPFRDLPSLVGVLVVSVPASIFVLLVYRRTSDQPAIEAVKRQIAASFFEIRLFNDDLRAILRAQWDLLRNNGRYLRLNLVPLLWMIVPFLFLIAQLQFHWGYEGLEPGTSTLLTVDLAREPTADAPRPEVRLEVPPGLRIESPGVWIPTRQQLAWRIAALEEGRHELGFELDGERYAKSVVVSGRIERRSPQRLAPGIVNQIFFPAESSLPGGVVRSITIGYPGATVWFLGLELHWLIVFFILTVIIALLLRKRFGVTF